jgi:hypothetical protein
MILNKELVRYQDRLFWVYRKLNVEKIKEHYVQDIKTLWDCDVVLKQKTPQGEVFLFIREIPDLEIVT